MKDNLYGCHARVLKTSIYCNMTTFAFVTSMIILTQSKTSLLSYMYFNVDINWEVWEKYEYHKSEELETCEIKGASYVFLYLIYRSLRKKTVQNKLRNWNWAVGHLWQIISLYMSKIFHWWTCSIKSLTRI